MVNRTSLNDLRRRAKRYGLELSCSKPSRETRCTVVVPSRITGGVSNLSWNGTVNQIDYWLQGFEKCKTREDFRLRTAVEQMGFLQESRRR